MAPEGLSLPAGGDHFLIGTIFDHSLDTQEARYRSAQLAIDHVNRAGGLEGRTFAMVHCTNEEDSALDGLDKDAATVEVAEWLATMAQVPAIIGPSASSRAEAVYLAVAERYGVLVLSPAATSPALTALDGFPSTPESPGLFWRTAPPDDVQGEAIAWDMQTNFDPDGQQVFRRAPSERVAVVYQMGSYGDGLAEAFGTAFQREGGREVLYPYSSSGGFVDALADVVDGNFDEVLFVSSEPADVSGFVLGTAPFPELDDTPVFLTDAARNVDVLDALVERDERLVQLRGTAPAQPGGPVYDTFAASYAAAFGGQDVSVHSFTAQSYDAAWLLASAHAWALYRNGGVDGRGLAVGFTRLSQGDEVALRASSWNVIRSSFREGNPVDVVGASGELDYDDMGETSSPVEVWTVGEGGEEFESVGVYVP